jgi:hypothetical protein
MNGDLRLRLRPLNQLDHKEEKFLCFLMDELGEDAAFGLHGDSDADEATIHYYLECIENGEDDSAYMTGDGNVFNIHIDKRVPFGMVVDFLIHELAHVHSWDCADDAEDHCDEFGKSYALLYRRYLELYEWWWSR